jgi:hypothetical protein
MEPLQKETKRSDMRKFSVNIVVLFVLTILLFVAFEGILHVVPADYNDIHDHAAFARQMAQGQRPYAGNFLVYLLVNVLSFFSSNVAFSEIVLCLMIAVATTYRFSLSEQKINQFVYSDSVSKNKKSKSSLYALSLLFVFAIPIPSYFSEDCFMYIGNYVPNVWHNSTILILFPFALLLFDLSYRQLESFENKRNWQILLLVTLNLFIKPSFFFVFICVYPLLMLIKYKFKKEFWYSFFPLVVGLCLMLLEYWVIYKIGVPTDKEASSVVFMPFYRNPELVDGLRQIPMAMFFSLLFPILYVVLNISKLWKKTLFWYSLLSFVVSVLIYFFISESGPRASHGNFYWQIVVCTWICFFVALMSLLKDFQIVGKTTKNVFLMGVYTLHVLVGVFYFIRLLVTGVYY